jgi:hypothetical protein
MTIAAAVLLLTGCAKELTPADGGSITVEASIGSMTKVASDSVASSFETGDKIAVYAWTGSATEVPAGRVVDGVVNTLGSDGKWAPASPMYWKPGLDAHYFVGVSPARTVSDFTADAFTLSGVYATDDLLIARNLAGVKPGSGAVALSFQHAMARLTVNVKVRNEFGASPAISVSVSAKSGATVNYLSGAVAATGDASELSLPAAISVPTGYTHSFSGIQVPQDGVKSIVVTVGGNRYIYTAGEDIPLTPGHHTTLGLVVGKDKIELSGVSVSDWTAGEALPGGIAMVDYSRSPLTFEAIEAGAQVSFKLAGTVTGVQYSTDGSTWKDYSSNTPITLTNVGDIVMFRGDNAGYYSDYDDYSHFSCSKACSVYGNIMSLVSSTDFATATTLTVDNAFKCLFMENSDLRSDTSKALLLPATSLTVGCYSQMFNGCTDLKSAPALPATTLANSCYARMFRGCISLSSAPALPATTLVENCYAYMFADCSSLNRITCAATDISATECTLVWLSDVASSGTFYGSSKADWTSNSDSGIPDGWTLADSFLPLTFEAIEAGAQVSFKLAGTVTGVQYSTDGSTWNDYSSNTPIMLTNVGDIVMFRGDNAGYYSDFDDYSHFSCSKACSVYGNIMSLVSSTDFATATELNEKYAFSCLFKDNTNLRSDASKALVLSATTLSALCYRSMFSGCSGLTKAPALPATTLGENCYCYMFAGCTGLTSAPALPAMTMAEGCYSYMFSDCSNLTNAPAILPATVLARSCYTAMFMACSNLSTVPVLPATTLAEGCYAFMFRNCSNLTTAPELSAMNLASSCYAYMFEGCSNLTTAPALPATLLAYNCYSSMFSGCSSLVTAPVLLATILTEQCYNNMFCECTMLNKVTCAATDISANDCTHYWLYGVAASGTFTTPSTTAWSSGKSGIPSGWTRVDLP